jgi:hypothetical protein
MCACDPLIQAERRFKARCLNRSRWECSLAAGRWCPVARCLLVSAICKGTVNPWFARPAASGDDISTENRTVDSDPGSSNFNCRLQADARFQPRLAPIFGVLGGCSPTLPFARISLRKPSEAVCEPRRVRLRGDTPGTSVSSLSRMQKSSRRSSPLTPPRMIETKSFFYGVFSVIQFSVGSLST